MVRHRGYMLIDLVLVGVVVSALIGGAYEIATRYERSARVGELVDVTKAMIRHMNVASLTTDRSLDAYRDGAVALQAAPDYWRESATTWRNPLGTGSFSGLAYGGWSDGGSFYAFFYDDMPRWACVDLATHLAQLGLVRVRLGFINRSSTGLRTSIDTTILTARCDESRTTPLNITLLGPAV